MGCIKLCPVVWVAHGFSTPERQASFSARILVNSRWEQRGYNWVRSEEAGFLAAAVVITPSGLLRDGTEWRVASHLLHFCPLVFPRMWMCVQWTRLDHRVTGSITYPSTSGANLTVRLTLALQGVAHTAEVYWPTPTPNIKDQGPLSKAWPCALAVVHSMARFLHFAGKSNQ